MNLLNNINPVKIKRRNFFKYLGASAVGLFVFSVTPLNIFRSKAKKLVAKKSKIHLLPNPDSVKREVLE